MKKIFFIFSIIICIVTINSLAHSIYDLWHKQDLVVSAKQDLEKEKKENLRLKNELVHVKSDNFIESVARDKLFMVKPGESGVIMPPNLASENSAKQARQLPNWQKWVNLFGF